MAHRWILTGVFLAVVSTTIANAKDTLGNGPSPQQMNEINESGEKTTPLTIVQTIAYLPFKGVVCVVGVVASFPVYVLSGMDPQVKNDTAAMREKYCSREYFLGPEWWR